MSIRSSAQEEQRQFFFELPTAHTILPAIIAAIPDSWGWIDGTIEAPLPLLHTGRAVRETGISLSRYSSSPTYVSEKPNNQMNGQTIPVLGKKTEPDLYAMCVHRLFPGFIFFEEAGYSGISFVTARRIVEAYLVRGYHGSLNFYRDCYRNNKFDNSARVELRMKGLPEHAGKGPERRPHLAFKYNPAYGGSEKDILSLLQACRSARVHPLFVEV